MSCRSRSWISCSGRSGDIRIVRHAVVQIVGFPLAEQILSWSESLSWSERSYERKGLSWSETSERKFRQRKTFLVFRVVVFLLGRPSVCLGPGLVLVCPCLPGSDSWAGFREKGRRPKNRSRRSFARADLFQVFPGMLAVLERRYRWRILTLVHFVVYSPSSQLRRFLPKRLHALSTYRRGPVEEPPRVSFNVSLSSLLFASIATSHVPLYKYVFSSRYF